MSSISLPDKALREIYAAWLEEGMEKAGFNQSSLARKSRVSRDTIWRVLHRKTGVSEKKLEQLSDTLGQPLPVLSDGSRQMAPTLLQRPAGARNGPQAPLTQVSSAVTVAFDVRPPMGEKARRLLELRIEQAQIEGRTVGPAELTEWLRLARWATEPEKAAGDEG